MLLIRVLIAGLLLAPLGGAEALVVEDSGVRVEITVEPAEDTAVVTARFVPVADGTGWHLYDVSMPKTGIDGVGRPTLLEFPAESGVVVEEPPSADVASHKLTIEMVGTYDVYPAGPVTITQRIRLPAGDGSEVSVPAKLWYMLCTDLTCLRPVSGKSLEVSLPTRVVAVPSSDAPAEVIASFGEDTVAWNMVRGEVLLRHDGGAEAELLVRFEPITPPEYADAPFHLYGMSTPMTGAEFSGIGRPTRFEFAAGSAARIVGELSADPPSYDEPLGMDVLDIFPPGPVTVSAPIQLPRGDGAPVAVTLQLTYMSCNHELCQRPTERKPLEIMLPSHPDGVAGAAVDSEPEVAPAEPVHVEEPAQAHVQSPWLRAALAAALALLAAELLGWLRARRTSNPPGAWRAMAGTLVLSAAVYVVASFAPPYQSAPAIPWVAVADVAELEVTIAEAHANGQAALLDFTGPSCVNCQKMAKDVFVLPEVAAAWGSGVPIEVDTDPPHDDLAAWQQQETSSQVRPLYLRIAPDGSKAMWNDVFEPGNEERVTALTEFLRGTGEAGAGDVAAGWNSSWFQFVLLAVLGGLFTLVMPCTYPMIPFTISFFSKQAAAGQRLAPLAACYSLGIVGFFALIGVVVAGLFGAAVTSFAGDPITNFAIGILFIVFAMSLFGAFLLQLPGGLEGKLGGSRSGYVGALLMGLTFAITAFTCTAPFAGLVLGEAVATGTWSAAIVGMVIYASVIAIPFFFLSTSPGLLKRMPNSGAWMSEFKVVGGFVELAAALKFIAISEKHWDWGPWQWDLFTRQPILAAWATMSLLSAAYIFGWLRLKDDAPVTKHSALRLLWGSLFAVLGIWLLGGLLGVHLGTFESFFPLDAAPLR